MKNTVKNMTILSIVSVILSSCAQGVNGTPSESSSSESVVEQSSQASSTQGKGEDELQLAEGINGDLPDIEYTYDAIVNAPVGIVPTPGVYEDNAVEKRKEWIESAKAELKKIEPALGEDATEEEIEELFKKMLYIAQYDYTPIEPVERFGYAIFKDDMINPVTNEKIEENMNVNIEIVLDASGSMANTINGVPMMDIAKNSIMSVVSSMPENANVGLRVFGHKGSNADSDMAESCAANELVHPIGPLNPEGINNALAPIQPTGWTSIASSIENGAADLSAFNGEKDLNILYIVTDGIETCGGSAVDVAAKLKESNTEVVLGIIGFNVDANQNKILNDIANAGDGYYANANDAAKLTAELQNIHELAFSDYEWETLDDILFSKIKGSHSSGLLYNKMVAVDRGPITEYNDLTELITNGTYTGDDVEEGLYKYGGNVYNRLLEMAAERKDKIEAILTEEYNKRVKESEDYLKSLENRKGATVARVRSTSRLDAESEYWMGYTGPGGTIEEMNSNAESIENEKKEESGSQ